MSTRQPTGGAIRAITLSRQYGSGGGEIGARLAAQLNWRLIDHELSVRQKERYPRLLLASK